MGSLGQLVYTIGANIDGFTEAAQSVGVGLDTIADKSASTGSTYEDKFLKALGGTNDVLSQTAASFREAANAIDPFALSAKLAGEALSATIPPAFQFSAAAQGIIDKQAGLDDAVTQSVAVFNEIAQAYQQGAASAQDVANAQNAMREAMEAAKPPLDNMGSGILQLGKGISEVGIAMVVAGAAMTELTEKIGDVATEAVTMAGNLAVSSAALGIFFGDANVAAGVLSDIKELAASSMFSFPELVGSTQRLAALGIEAGKIPDILQAITSAVEGLGPSASIDGMTEQIARIESTGTLTQRSLVSLGLSWSDIAAQMGVSATEAKNQMTKGLLDTQAVVDTVVGAMQAKFGGMADAIQGTVPFALKKLKDTWDDTLITLGQSLAPIAVQITNALGSVLKTVGSLVDAFATLPTPVQDAVIVVAGLAAAMGPLTLGLGALAIAGGELITAIPRIAEALAGLTESEISDAGAAGSDAAAHQALNDVLLETKPQSLLAMEGIGSLGAALGIASVAAASFGAAIIATLSQVEDLKTKYTALHDEIAKNDITAALNAGKSVEDLEKFGYSLSQIKTAIGDTKESIGAAGSALKGLGLGIEVVGLNGQDFTRMTQQLVDKMNEANAAVTAAQKVYNELLAAYNSGNKDVYPALIQAQIDLEAAIKKANPTLKDTGAALEAAKASYAALRAEFDGGNTTVSQLGTSMETLRVVAQNSGKDFATLIGVNKELNDGQKALADAQRALFVPALLDQATALAGLTDAQQKLTSAKEAEKQTLVTLAAANAAYEASQTPANAKALEEAELAEVAAKEKVKDALSGLTQANETYKVSVSTTKTITDLLASADKEYLDLVRTGTERSILPYADALAAEEKAKENSLVAAINLKSAEHDLQTARDSGDPNRIKAAEDALEAARAGGKIAADALKVSETNLNDYRTASDQINKALVESQTALDDAYTKFFPHQKSMADEMDEVRNAQNRLIQAINEEKDARQALADLEAAGINSGQAVTEALARETAAHQNLKSAATETSDAERRLQQDWGVSAQAIQFIMDPLRNLTPAAQQAEAAMVSLGITPQAKLQELADKAKAAYDAIASSGIASSEQVRQAAIAAIQDQIAAWAAAGQTIPADWQIQLAKLETAEKDYQTNSVNRWGKFFTDIDSAFKDFQGKAIDTLVTDLFHGNSQNDQLDQQAQKVRDSLAQQTADYQQFVATTEAQMDALPATYQASLDKQLASLQDSLAKQQDDYNQFLADKTTAYDRSVADIQEKMANDIQSNAESLQNDLDNLKQQLSDKTEAYSQYVEDVNTKLLRIGQNTAQDIGDETTKTNRNIADKQTAYDRAAQDTQKQIDALTKSNAKGNAQQIADLKLSLQRKKEDLDTYIQRAKDDLQTYTDEHKAQAQQQTDDLNTELQRQTEAYDEYVSQNKVAADKTTADHKAQLDQQLSDLQTQLDRDTQDYNEAIALKKKSLDDFTAANLAAQQQAVEDNKAKEAVDLANLQKSLDDKTAAYDAYVKDNNAQLQAILDQHKTIWNQITDLLTGAGGVFDKIAESWLNKVVSPMADKLFSGLSGVFTSIGSKIGDWLGGIIDKIPGLSGLGSILSSAASGAGSLPIGIGSSAAQTAAGIPGLLGDTASTAGSGASGVAGALGSFSSIFGMATGAISAVTGVLSLFGVGQGGQKDRLDLIANATAYLAWAYDAGGLHEAILDTRNAMQYFLDTSFDGWYKEIQDGVRNDLDAINQRLQIFCEATFPDYAKAMENLLGADNTLAALQAALTPATVPTTPLTVVPAALASGAGTPISLRGNVYIDSKELFGSFVRWAEDNGLVIPQS